MKYLEKLKELESKATASPWYPGFFWRGAIYIEKARIHQLGTVGKNSMIDDENGKNNAAFIVESRTAVPRLIKALEYALQGVDALEKEKGWNIARPYIEKILSGESE